MENQAHVGTWPHRLHGATPGMATDRLRSPVTLVGSSLLGMTVATLYVYSLGILIEPLQAAFGWSRAAISSGLTIVSVVAVVLAPFVGTAIDRWGARRIALAGIFIYSTAMALLVFAGPEIWTWWSGWSLVAAGSILIKPTVWCAAIVSRVEAHRGIALAAALCGSGLASMAGPPLLHRAMEAFDWRAVYLSIGAFGLFVVLPIAYACFYDARDLERTGNAPKSAGTRPATGLTVRQGLMSRPFIQLALCGYLATASGTGLLVHFIPIMTAEGLARAVAVLAGSAFGIASIAARLGAGFALDRIDGRIVGVVAFALPTIAPALLISGIDGTLLWAIVIASLIGFAIGSEIDVLAFMSARYFGLRSYGTLWGTVAGMITLGSGTGPLIAGAIFDRFGTYAPAFWLAGGALLVSMTLIATLPPPRAEAHEPG